MKLTRRELLAVAGATLLADGLRAEAPPSRMGVVIHSYPIRGKLEQKTGFADPIRFVAFCRERGAGGVQAALAGQHRHRDAEQREH